MNKETFITKNKTEKESTNKTFLAMLERTETLRDTARKNLTKAENEKIDVLCDYETVNDSTRNKEEKVNIMHVYYKNSKSNLIKCYLKSNDMIYCKVSEKIAVKTKFKSERDDKHKEIRYFVNDKDFTVFIKDCIKAISTETKTETKVTKKATATKKTEIKEA